MRIVAKKSAGILMYRQKSGKTEVLLAHPGGPFWKNKDAGAWTIPKGEIGDEESLAAAKREFFEETGFQAEGEFIPLKAIVQKNGKLVQAWAVEGDLDTSLVKSNEFELQWPPRSGKRMMVPEVDRAEWFSVEDAVEKINPAQAALVLELEEKLVKKQDK
jgi:predicted NUDIX family NTP pyrophosphohydrolase